MGKWVGTLEVGRKRLAVLWMMVMMMMISARPPLIYKRGVVHNFGKCNGHWGDGRGASNFSLGRAASEDMGEDLNVGLVGGHFQRAK